MIKASVPGETGAGMDDMDDESKPTAVLVVHGIGQQMPMDTLRSLVTTVFGKRPDGSDRKITSKVDRESSFLDLRRLVLPADEGRGRVDFFEVYWAPILSGGSAAAVISWTVKMLLRRPKGKQMCQIVWTLRGILFLLIALAVLLSYLFRDTEVLRYLAPLVPLLVAVRPILEGGASRCSPSHWLMQADGLPPSRGISPNATGFVRSGLTYSLTCTGPRPMGKGATAALLSSGTALDQSWLTT